MLVVAGDRKSHGSLLYILTHTQEAFPVFTPWRERERETESIPLCQKQLLSIQHSGNDNLTFNKFSTISSKSQMFQINNHIVKIISPKRLKKKEDIRSKILTWKKYLLFIRIQSLQWKNLFHNCFLLFLEPFSFWILYLSLSLSLYLSISLFVWDIYESNIFLKFGDFTLWAWYTGGTFISHHTIALV